ncbi:hypothetical protein BOX15_Mlig002459g3 [Macrostomum lignano]|uniref:Sodium/calcium exchanger membrane region domain-containing protein n=1 Tax=Macrostomum lignano TaxID=282301 RepID=A0A267DIE5_9PLAT|nr:hypothetical protein BOX15_Mlig002459g3 [Macrostomum lignano]
MAENSANSNSAAATLMAAEPAPPSTTGTRIRRRRRGPAILFLAGWLLACTLLGVGTRSWAGEVDTEPGVAASGRPGRHLLEEVLLTEAGSEGKNACTPRSVETFPPDLFTLEQKRQGAIIIHVLVAVWLFAALAVVCDDYFVSSLEVICDVLDLKSDVAGATFMAAGSSAPELFTSIIGVFFAKSDVGISTIVGSAVFNILFIVSLCGVFATQAIYLSWWPIFRDCGYYCLSVVALIVVIQNGFVDWYESVIFVVMYALYIVIMYYNEAIDRNISNRYPSLGTGASAAAAAGGARRLDESNMDDERVAIVPSSGEGGGTTTYSQLSLGADKEGGGEGNVEEFESPLTMPQGLVKRIYWVVMLPWTCVFLFTIPDCRRPGRWRKFFFITFINSVLWIAGMSYLLVWMVCAVGDTLGIPDTVMGLTILAAGTSVPDAMASVFVARDGFGDMAVSNSIGSNVFDILVGLGVPWFIDTIIREPGSTVVVNSNGLTYSTIMLLSTVVFLFVAVYLNKMRLDRKLGAACLVVYIVFITFSILYETNVFGEMNPPPCPRQRL